MTKELFDAGFLRDLLHNLNPENEDHINIYNQARYHFISQNEGVSKLAYDDATGKSVTDINKVIGKVTIGIGFNMDEIDSRTYWNSAFNNKIDFDLAKSGNIELTEQQIRILYNHSVNIREEDLRNYYFPIFSKLRLNERLAIEDAYFNLPSLVDYRSNFMRHIKEYYRTGDQRYLLEAVDEIKYRSNKKKIRGIQNRRNKQAVLLDSTKAPFYSKPFDPRLPNHLPIHAIPLKTIIPRGTESWEKGGNPEYYIWRTQCDDKVRESHFLLEGRVFPKNNPPATGHPKDAHNCRCWAEELPKDILIKEELNIIKTLNHFDLGASILFLELSHHYNFTTSHPCS